MKTMAKRGIATLLIALMLVASMPFAAAESVPSEPQEPVLVVEEQPAEEAPEAPTDTEEPETPSTEEAPEVPEVPEAPEQPETPETPETLEAPEAPVEQTLIERLAEGGEIVWVQDVTLTENLTVPTGTTLTLAGKLTVPAGMTLQNEGTLILKGAAEIAGTLLNTGAIELFGALTFAEGAAFDASQNAIIVREGGSVTGSEHYAAGAPEATALPYGFAGMPEGFALTDEMIALKAALAAAGTATELARLTEGVDYRTNEIYYFADTQALAEQIAAAYSGTLDSFSYGVAVATLVGGRTVLDAVTAASRADVNLPPVGANMIVRLAPQPEAEVSQDSESAFGVQAPVRQSWEDFRDGDPYLANPRGVQVDDATVPYQWMHDIVNTFAAWGVTQGKGVNVAVLDSGVRDHEDFNGVTFYGDATNVSEEHGTHVAGIIAAVQGNYTGGAGIAPQASLYATTALPEEGGSGSDADIIRAINATIMQEDGIDVINMSLGGYTIEDPLYERVFTDALNAGIPIFAAMGNDGSNTFLYPAGFKSTIAVGATNRDNSRASFSNYGDWADIAAPGVGILSTVETGGYEAYNGTSMATPVVAGVAALYLSTCPDAPDARGLMRKDVNGDGVADAKDVAALKVVLQKATNPAKSAGIGKVIDASKLFEAVKTQPTFTFTDGNGKVLTKITTVPSDTKLTMSGAVNGQMIVYTLDGTTPRVVNGEVTVGEVYNPDNEEAFDLSLEKYAGSRVTLRAMCISGMGVVGSLRSQTVAVGAYTSKEVVKIDGSAKLAAGRAYTYKAAVMPADGPQTVAWYMVNAGDTGATIAKSSGRLQTKAGREGMVTIRATLVSDPSKSATLDVTVVDTPLVASIKLSEKKHTLTYSSENAEDFTLEITEILDTKKDPADPEIRWTSSNPAVASVSGDGMTCTVTAAGRGTASIICTAMDGSNRSATCVVTVMQLVESIEITGQSSALRGKTVNYKAVVLPANATNKAVIWTLDDEAVADGFKISASGAVRIPALSTIEAFTVTATAKDAVEIPATASLEVSIVKPITSLTAQTYNGLKAATVWSVALPDENGERKTWQPAQGIDLFYNQMLLTEVVKRASGEASTDYAWTSANPKIATVEQLNGGGCIVTGVAKGRTNVTCAATDGSGKKASVTIIVNTPMSSLNVVSVSGGYAIAGGKTQKNSAAIGTAYGAPTSKKITWDFDIYHYTKIGVDDEGNDVFGWAKDAQMTYIAKRNKAVQLSSAGVLKLASNWRQFLEVPGQGYAVGVFAVAGDGSGIVSSPVFYQMQLRTKMKFLPNMGAMRISKANRQVMAWYDELFTTDVGCIEDYVITISNPRVVSAYGYAEPSRDADGNVVDYRRGVVLTSHGKTGTATITILANDGSNISLKLKATAY